jgi:xylono-1,5-lactonase
MVERTAAECIWNLGAELGEGPVWSQRDKALWFVDIKGRKVHRLTIATHVTRSWDAPQQVGFVLPTAAGGWIAGLQSGLHRFDPATGAFTPLPPPEDHPPQNRLNDGCVDARGRLWFGTMDDSEQTRSGALYRLDDDGRSRVQDPDYGIANGPAVSPDGRTFYHTETMDRVIYAFDLGADGGLSRRRPFARVERPGAFPDGTAVDAEGCLWVALFGGWGLERYSPSGGLLEYLPLPCANVTKPAFGGDDLKTVYVTTAKLHLDPQARAAQTLAGGLFAFRAETPGLPQPEISRGV